MTLLLKILLVSHVTTGLVGVIACYSVWLGLLKKELKLDFLKKFSLLAPIMLFISWLTGGYYYWDYYGMVVKPLIKAGTYPWAHLVFTEGKEHLFLFLPFLAVVIALVIWKQTPGLVANLNLKKELTILAGITTLIGIVITFSGVVISGAVR